ncbi:MAG: hypothetical protein R6U31_06015 [bacterium]
MRIIKGNITIILLILSACSLFNPEPMQYIKIEIINREEAEVTVDAADFENIESMSLYEGDSLIEEYQYSDTIMDTIPIIIESFRNNNYYLLLNNSDKTTDTVFHQFSDTTRPEGSLNIEHLDKSNIVLDINSFDEDDVAVCDVYIDERLVESYSGADTICDTIDIKDYLTSESISVNVNVYDKSGNYSTLTNDYGSWQLSLNIVGEYEFYDKLSDLDFSDKYLYATSPIYGLRIFDFSDPANITLISSVHYPWFRSCYETILEDEYAYMFAGGLQIIDISDPVFSSFVSKFEVGYLTTGGFIADNVAYIADPSYGVYIVDISDKENPLQLSLWDSGGSPRDVLVYNDLAYIIDNQEGLIILDISNKQTPVEISRTDIPGGTEEIGIKGNYAYISCSDYGLIVMDISDSTNPVKVTESKFYGDNSDLDIYGDMLFVSGETSGLRVFNIGNPEELDEIFQYQDSNEPFYQFCIAGEYFVGSLDDYIIVIDPEYSINIKKQH